jgi:hypothetical protein
MTLTYTICNAMMIIAIRELYTGDYFTFLATTTLSALAYLGFLGYMYNDVETTTKTKV